MSIKHRGLGKGLGALLSVTQAPAVMQQALEGTEALLHLPIEHLRSGPFQPRQDFEPESLKQLSESIRTQGVLQAIVVRKKEGADYYEIIAGERRWRAAQMAGLGEIPALVKNVTDQVALAIALIENIQRENLNPIEEAKALKRLADETALTHLQVAEAVGKSRSAITNFLRLLTLNPDVQAFVEAGQLEMGHAKALLGLRGQMQSQLGKTIVARGMSVRETERLVARLQENAPKPLSALPMDPNVRSLEQSLAEKLGAAVIIRQGRQGKGTLSIRYNDLDELEGILAHIK
jgi:ParB family chromosome partitioning protein